MCKQYDVAEQLATETCVWNGMGYRSGEDAALLSVSDGCLSLLSLNISTYSVRGDDVISETIGSLSMMLPYLLTMRAIATSLAMTHPNIRPLRPIFMWHTTRVNFSARAWMLFLSPTSSAEPEHTNRVGRSWLLMTSTARRTSNRQHLDPTTGEVSRAKRTHRVTNG